MPCSQKQKRLERDLYIRSNQKVVNRFENITDPLEILMLMCEPPSQDPLVKDVIYPKSAAELCSSLSQTDAARLIDKCISLLETGHFSISIELAEALRRATTVDLSKLQAKLLELNELDSPFLFANANARIRDKLLRRIHTDPSGVFPALAWICDSLVVETFNRWRHEYAELTQYMLEAGWELTNSGERRNLCSDKCVQLVPVQNSSSTSGSCCIQETSKKCVNCGRVLIVLVDIGKQLIDELQLDANENIQVICCEFCSMFTTWFSELNDRHEYRNTQVELPGWSLTLSPMPRSALKAAKDLRSPYFAVGDFGKGLSQIGGYPTWLQTARYPKCPGCFSTMSFLLQVSTSDLEDSDGIYHGFKCSDGCRRFTAVCYQRT